MKSILAGFIALAAFAQAHDMTVQVTWAREVSRVFDRHCTSCHHDGGAAFSLTRYQDAHSRAKAIALSVLDRRMPPFGAVKGFGDLRDDKSLTQEQIGLILSWVQGGSPEGDVSLEPKGPPKMAAQTPDPKTGAEWTAGRNKLAADTTFVAIRPKALHGDSIRVVAEKPDGSMEPLVWFYHCDPKMTFYFRKPIRLPAGTRILKSTPDAMVSLVEPAR